MKKIFNLCVSLLLLNCAQAQTTDWKLSGNTVYSDSKLGTNTGYDLIIETNNLERMLNKDNGSFGIGTSLLHLVSGIKIQTHVIFQCDGSGIRRMPFGERA